MNHQSRLMVLAVVACFAANSIATTNGAFCQVASDIAKQTSTKPQAAEPNDQQSAPPSTPRLRGGAVEQTSPLTILQRKGQPTEFDAESRRRAPGIEQSMYKKLQAEFDRSPNLQGELNDSNFILPQNLTGAGADRQLQGWLTSPARDDLQMWNIEQPLLDPGMESAPKLGTRSPSLSPRKAVQISGEIESQFLGSHKPNDVRLERPASRINPTIGPEFDVPASSQGQSAASSEIEASLNERPTGSTSEISGQLKRASRRQALPDIDGLIRAQQAVAKPLLDQQSSIAATQIKAVFRRMEHQSVNLETDAKLLVGRDLASSVSWDAWYARVAKLSEPGLVSAVESSRGPAGANTVSITVRANHQLSVSLIGGDNPSFNAAILRAYRGLNGNPALAFPAGSHRTEVTFFADNNHIAPGDVSGVTTESCVGDTERLHNR